MSACQVKCACHMQSSLQSKSDSMMLHLTRAQPRHLAGHLLRSPRVLLLLLQLLLLPHRQLLLLHRGQSMQPKHSVSANIWHSSAHCHARSR